MKIDFDQFPSSEAPFGGKLEKPEIVVTDVSELLGMLKLKAEEIPFSKKCSDSFPLKVPLSYVKKMKPGCSDDPLLLQVYPLASEETKSPGFLRDPVGDGESILSRGLLQKYDGRVLLLLTHTCPVHCRFCFRRHLKTSENTVGQESLERTLAVIKNDTSIQEVILSGGEPLMASGSVLEFLLKNLEGVDHIKRLRVHTRLPVVSPLSINCKKLNVFALKRISTFFVVHINHPQEMDTEFVKCVQKIRSLGVTVLSQTVLLKGVNDDEKTLTTLFSNLVDVNILPYYLHQLDKVMGSAHFLTDEEVGQALINGVRRKLPGYAIPRYVKEIPAQAFKQPIP